MVFDFSCPASKTVTGFDAKPVNPSPATDEIREDEASNAFGGMSGKSPAGYRHDSATFIGGVEACPTTETLDKKLSVRVSVGERDAVFQRARTLGIKPSKWLRAVLRDALDTRSQSLEKLEREAIIFSTKNRHGEAVEQLRRVGKNLNQCLREKREVDSNLLQEVLAKLDGLRKSLGDEVSL